MFSIFEFDEDFPAIVELNLVFWNKFDWDSIILSRLLIELAFLIMNPPKKKKQKQHTIVTPYRTCLLTIKYTKSQKKFWNQNDSYI